MPRKTLTPATTVAAVLGFFRTRDVELVGLAFDQVKTIVAQRRAKPAVDVPAAPVALAAVDPPVARKAAAKKGKKKARKLTAAEHSQRVKEGIARRKAALAAAVAPAASVTGETGDEVEQGPGEEWEYPAGEGSDALDGDLVGSTR